ncbi:O-antigen ligase family protein [Roseimaritima ulvae]|nr:O-antigen ligase family protein [Roseimaritima ulvae]
MWALKKTGKPHRPATRSQLHRTAASPSSGGFRTGVVYGLQAVVIGTLMLMPAWAAWDFGGVLPWTQWALATTLLLLAVPVAVVLIIQAPISRRKMSLAIPVILLVAWTAGWLQTLPLPVSMVEFVAQQSSETYQQWLPTELRSEALSIEQPEFKALASGNAFISISPWQSRMATANFAVFSAAVLFSAVVFRRKWTMVFAFALTACSGAGLAFLSSLHHQAPLAIANAGSGDRSFGPFVNANNAACYLNLTLAFAIGWLTYSLTKPTDRNVPDARYRAQQGAPLEKLAQVIQLRIRHLSISTVIAFLLCFVIAVGVVSTTSRGGLLGTAVGLAAVVTLGLCRTFNAHVLRTMVAAGGLAFVFGMAWMLNQGDARHSGSIGDDRSVSTRLDHWSDASLAAWQFLPLGSGVGTYRFAYLPFQQHGESEWFLNADNLAVEWFVEGGIWELPLLTIGVVALVWMLIKLSNVRHAPHLAGLVVAVWFMLASQATSQLFDFGLLLPANYLLVAVLCGACIGYHDQVSRKGKSLTRRSRTAPSASQTKAVNADRGWAFPWPLLTTRVAYGLCCGGAVLTLVVATSQLNAAAHSDHWVRRAKLLHGNARLGVDWEAMGSQNALLLSGLDENSQDPDVHSALAKCWILQSRLAAVEDAEASGLTPQEAWRVSSPAVMRTLLFDSRGTSMRQNLATELSPAQYQALQNARTHALFSLLLCPLNPEIRAVLVDLDFMAQDPASSAQLLSQLAELRPRATRAGDWAVRKALVNPGKEAAATICRQHLERFPDRLPTLWAGLTRQQDVDFTLRCLPDQLPVLLAAAELTVPGTELCTAVMQHAERHLTQAGGDGQEANAVYRGRLAELNQQFELAVKYYTSAVKQNPTDHELRFRLVVVLEHEGRFAEAKDHLHRCLLQSPGNAVYRAKQDALRNKI